MKKIIAKEKHKLPLTYKYLEFVKNKTREKQTNSTIECEIYQTDQYVKLKPPKFLTRLL
ncbi:hypothetical protein CHFL109739_16015 [Chryseobacterium flavum]|uniref:hypothetical protein n=1 Tax=Chryseobacterium flavum TaxID=415851 RepID=UPI0013009E02|nr:hypothetical protein [Chryseobacterium flavum]